MDNLIDQFQLYRLRTKRDEDAFGRIYDRYIERIYRFVSLKLPTKEAAQDVTSEAFLRFWQYVQDEKGITNVRALLYRIARNLVVDYYRASSRTISVEQSVTFSLDVTSYDNEDRLSDQNKGKRLIEAKADLALIVERVSRLKEDYRDVLMLRLMDDLSFQDIAIVLGKKPGTVRVIFHRAMKALDTLAQQNSDTPFHV